MATYVPDLVDSTTVERWVESVWEPEIGLAAYEEMVVAPHFKELQPVRGELVYRKQGQLGINTLADNASGASLLFSSAPEAAVIATPGTSYCAVEVNMNLLARMIADPQNMLRRACELTIAQGVDVACAAKFDDLTSVVGTNATNIAEATLLDAIVTLNVNAKQKQVQGQTRNVMCFHPHQLDDLLGIASFVQYQITGVGPSAVVTGFVKTAYNVDFYETGNILETGTDTFHNGLFLPGVTFGIGYNQKPTVKLEDYLLVKRIICWTDFGTMTCWPTYGVDYITQDDA